MADSLITPQDLLDAADQLAAGVSRATAGDFSAHVPGLEWDVRTIIEHLVDVLGFYTLHLIAASRERLSVDVTCHGGLGTAGVIHILTTEAKGLATATRLLDPSTRIFHFHGNTDPSGILALACTELLVHGNDVARGLGTCLAPRPELAAKILARLFPTAPRDTDPWVTLLWATGRGSLSGRPHVGPDWTYRTAPLEYHP